MDLKIKAVSPKIGREIPYPYYATAGAAAMDLCACVDEPVEVAPGALVSLPTGIAIALPSAEYVALVFARSGLGVRHGITLSNGVGVIDSDYRGEIRVGLTNLSSVPYTIQPGDRIAQLAVLPVAQARLQIVEELDETERGSGGFGSTGT
ncbi:dUTP diphosphatase [Flavonifractor hominis]|uniref:Deoxyuridine 5'-triphosphate nucleotidohydrolase n=1 Tax=Flavonifractor hominis TaxID=3133178 RepID=A0ABV1EPI0_9FIRM